MSLQRSKQSIPLVARFVFVCICLLVVLLGAMIGDRVRERERNQVHDSLRAIGSLKASGLSIWMKERRADAEVLFSDQNLTDSLYFLSTRGAGVDSARQTADRLKLVMEAYEYQSVQFVNTSGDVIFSAGPVTPLGANEKKVLARSIAENAIVVTNLHNHVLHDREQVGFDIHIPLLHRQDRQAQAFGAIIIRVNPEKFIFPLVRSWPGPSHSAEVLLVSRDGDQVVFLNELRFVATDRANLTFPKADKSLQAVLALRGFDGVTTFKDHRGVEVLASAHKVEATDWSLIVKMDTAEIYRPLEAVTRWSIYVTLVFLAGAFVAFFYWRQSFIDRLAAQQYESEMEREALEKHFEYLSKYANDIIILTDSDWRILEFNDRAMDVYQYGRDELQGMAISELEAEAEGKMEQVSASALAEGSIFEDAHKRKDGTTFSAEVSLHGLNIEGTEYRQLIIRDVTERKVLQASLVDSEERLSAIIHAARDGIVMLDASGIVCFWSPAAEEIFGYTEAEALGNPVSVLIIPKSVREAHHIGYRKFIETGSGPFIDQTIELRGLHKDGSWLDIEIAISKLVLHGELHAVGIIHNITERKRLKRESGRKDAILNAVFEVLPDLLFLMDLDGTVIDYRAQNDNDLYLPPEAILGKRKQDMLPAAVAQQFEENMLAAARGVGKPVTFEYALEMTQGLRYFEARLMHLPAAQQFIAVVRDISDRKKALRSELALGEITNASLNEIYVLDAVTLKFLDANVGARRNLGYSIEELYGLALHDLQTDFTGDTFNELINPLRIGEKEKIVFESFHQRKNGTSYPVEVHLQLSAYKDKRAFIAFVLDITERRHLEEQLRKTIRAKEALSACNEVLARADSEQELLDDICKIITSIGGYKIAWVGLAEENEHRTVRPVAKSGFIEGYLEQADIRWDDSPYGQGPAGQAIKTGQYAVCQDIETDPAIDPWRDKVRKLGCRSIISLPLIRNDDECFGVLIIYAGDACAFGEEEAVQLMEMADDLAYGLQTLRVKLEKDRYSNRYSSSLIQIIAAIALTVEKRDPYTAGHMRHVAQLSVAIAKEMRLADFQIEGVRLGADIHDIGKIYIPAEILNRPGKLTHAEFEMIKSHADVGYDIIKGVEFPWPVAEMVLQHHEKLDGSGYPQGLKGDEIVLEAQIIAVSDVVEAISSHRPYRAALGLDKGIEIIRQGKGTQFNPDAVDACIKIVTQEHFTFD